MSEWIKVPNDADYQTATECIGCGCTINLGYSYTGIFIGLCDECKDAIRFAKELQKEQVTENVCHKKNARIFSCEKCGYGINDIYLTNENDYPIDPAYCPNCGRKVVG